MKFAQLFIATSAVLSGSLSQAYSADIIEPDSSMIELPIATAEAAELSLEVVSGWYIRGDIGADFASTNRLFTHSEKSQLSGTRYGDTASYGFGAGYQLTDNFRLDGTASYSGRPVNSLSSLEVNCSGLQDECNRGLKSRANVWELMANAYIDLPTEFGFTPYLGAGVGVARVSYKSTTQAQVCNDGSTCNTGFYGQDNWRPAWALMAGFAIPISEYATLDIGYKYSDIGRGVAFETGIGAQRDRGIASHQLRAGVRIQTW